MPKFKAHWANLVKEVGQIAVDQFVELFHEFVISNVKNGHPEKIIDVSLLRWLCNTLENSLDKKEIVDDKVDKKKIVIDEYVKLKPPSNTQQFKQILEDLIEDLHNSGSIKKLSSRTKLYYRAKSCCISNDTTK
jgi:uncharacterized membrane-anchored protein YjiN (DUF445 family)